MLRQANECENGFPYRMNTVCYIEVSGSVVTNPSGVVEMRGAIARLGDGTSKLYAVWPGQWRSDLFEVDYAGVAEAFGVS